MRDPHETCLEIENHLPLWAGGDLEADVLAAVESHLARCEGCARSAIRARAARGALERGLRVESARMGSGPDPWPAIRVALRSEGFIGGAEPAPIARPAFRRWSPAWPVAAAVLVGLFLAGTWLPSESDSTTIPSSTRQAGERDTIAHAPREAPPRVGPTVALPASLRRLSPSDPRMRDTAWLFRPAVSPDMPGASEIGSATQLGSTVSLDRVQLLPRR